MTDTQSAQPDGSERANDLYWHSDQTIDEIVQELDIGRNALYASVHPVPAGRTCPDCGERMVFTNRTNRSRGIATCRACGAEADASHVHEAQPGPAAELEPAEALHADPDGWGWGRWRDELASVEPGRYALVGGAAALGVVVGAAAARAIREMR